MIGALDVLPSAEAHDLIEEQRRALQAKRLAEGASLPHRDSPQWRAMPDSDPDVAAETYGPIPPMSAGSYAMSPLALRNRLFGLGNDPAVHYKERWNVLGGGFVEYNGPGLSQRHATVFYRLIHELQGKPATEPLRFNPWEFVTLLGWAHSVHSVKSLKKCLIAMRGAVFILESSDSARATGRVVGMVKEFEFEDKHWTVELDPRAAALFCDEETPSYLNIARHKQLREGLPTWLYGFIRANNCKRPFGLAALREACGSRTKNLGDFGKEVARALSKIQKTGAIEKFVRSKGMVCIWR
jgi:hypothetical protein